MQPTQVNALEANGDQIGIDDVLPFMQSTTSPIVKFSSSQWLGIIKGKGQIFNDARDLRQSLYMFSLAHEFDYNLVRNSPSRIFAKCKAPNCPWTLTANAIGQTQKLMVRIYNGNHSHSAQDVLDVKHKRDSRLLSQVMKSKFIAQPDTSANDVCNEFLTDYGIKLTYKQGWRCKEKAISEIFGEPSQSYMLIPWFCQQAREGDPNTVAKWTSSLDHRFVQLFVAYGCSIKGFVQSCRPLLYIDGCHLSGPYRGTCLSASAFDADNNLYPVAYGVVSGEIFSDWMWFLTELKASIRDKDVIIISDRHAAIKGAVGAVFGSDHHGFCYRHIKEDFSGQVGKYCAGRKRAKEDCHNLLDAIAYARLDDDYNLALDNLRAYCPHLATWVENESDVNQWAISQFPHKRWDNITTNLAESFNAWIQKERRHPIFQFVQEHHKKLAEKIYRHKMDVSKWKNGVGPRTEVKLLENVKKARMLVASPYGINVFNVRVYDVDFKVNLILRECTCKVWDQSGIPCVHACAAIRCVGANVYSFVDECFMQQTQVKIYQHTMVPIETHNMPNLDHLSPNMWSSHQFLHPPLTSNPPGRPQKKRRESQFMDKRTYYCSQCLRTGHNRSTCKNPNPR